ncbi:MAG: elongation factor Ts [Acidobacteria bacterium]|nr:elongation factor Ts [Acidobacteriota bacterium]
MAITAAQVKELREKTGAGMMDCQRALAEANGDLEEAVKVLRKKGLSAAAKKAGRTAKDGLVAVALSADGRRAGIVELNCETDFVARTAEYQEFAQALANQAMAEGLASADAAKAAKCAGDPEHTVEQAIAGKIAKIGENILLSRVASMQAGTGTKLGSYIHMGGKIGVVVEISSGADEETVKDVAMHVAAAEPRFVSRDVVPPSVVDEEREIAKAQAAATGKPAQVVEKIAEGKLGKFFEQVCLVEQPFVKNPELKVGDMLKAKGDVVVKQFARFKLGEGAAQE